MLTQRAERLNRFTRRDAGRLGIAAVVLVVLLSAILAVDFLQPGLQIEAGRPAVRDIVATNTITFESDVQTAAERERVRNAVEPQYDYSVDKALDVSVQQVGQLRGVLAPVDRAFDPATPAPERQSTLEQVLPDLSKEARATLVALEPTRWPTVKGEGMRVLETVERTEVRDAALAGVRGDLSRRFGEVLSDSERTLAEEIILPFVAANSTYSEVLTEEVRNQRAAAVEPVRVRIQPGQIIVRAGDPITPADIEILDRANLRDSAPDVAAVAGWFLLAALLVGLLLAWVWRFRPEVWHRNNVLVLVGLLLVVTTFVLKLTAGRAAFPFLLPIAAVGMLIAVLLDAGAATVLMAVLALIAGAVNGNSLEMATYVFLGGFAGIVAVRRGDRLQVFVQAGLAIFIVQALVVSAFSLFGARDPRGVLELWGASAASAGGAAVAAVGSFAVLGNLFGILTVFQLLELANPSQPLLRRLLVETPGTYHHSIMVGNLAERAAEAIGADPLISRVAAYYHDIGKLANPYAFIENQAGGENIHDELEPDVSAQILKQHVVDGIDLAYQSKLPKSIIAFIPQHHGTATMAYFLARAREHAAQPYGGLQTVDGRKAGDAVDERKFRHIGPKPQSREAALIMLADGVEASVRSLAARDEPAIRAMVARIIEERLADGQFDECELTLRDIERIREAFIAQLLGMYHTRIAYPQNKVVEIESRRAAGGGPTAS
ncbi:MAG: HDIG domain-containing protein [Chloroflexota bacterium]|nr:HDIG domain-containing protein [Chloroflexota bacterium]